MYWVIDVLLITLTSGASVIKQLTFRGIFTLAKVGNGVN
jgi:hypothetical protein